jgi:pimeloyl-ACP methyl ester carboxylesterase
MEHVTSADGTRIAVQHSGHGPALILVVGAFGDRTSTASLSAGLTDYFTVYEYDRRGRGDSGNQADYAIERETEDLAAVIDSTGGPAAVFGHSSGGALALETAARGQGVSRLVVYEPPYYPDGPTDHLADELAEMSATGRDSEAAERFLALVGTPAQVLEQMKAGPYWAHMQAYALTLPYELRLGNNGTVPRGRFGHITAPTLALAGGQSGEPARHVAEAIASAIPNGHARVLAGQGHGVADEVLIPLLTDFLA